MRPRSPFDRLRVSGVTRAEGAGLKRRVHQEQGARLLGAGAAKVIQVGLPQGVERARPAIAYLVRLGDTTCAAAARAAIPPLVKHV